MKKNKFLSILLIFILIVSSLCACDFSPDIIEISSGQEMIIPEAYDKVLLASEYNGTPYIEVNNNIPDFSDYDKSKIKTFEIYSNLDGYGRCGMAYACISKDTMPNEDRESLSSVTPSGWNNKKYDFIDGGWVYNRAHLIGFQLAGEQANELNLITGTRYFNVEGMLPFENMIADYIKETNNHVLYRVTPIFTDKNLVCEGVLMEAWSIEDEGDGICFNVFCYNVQPRIKINYLNGDNWENDQTNNDADALHGETYILNTNSKKYHKPGCSGALSISDKNKEVFNGKKEKLNKDGYSPCGICNP